MTFLLAALALLPVQGHAFLLQEPDRIQELIRKLGAEDYATREQATEELRRIGKPARAALQKAAEDSEDPEVRERAQALLDEKPRPEKPAPRRVPLPAPGRPGLGGGTSLSVRTVNGDSTYSIRPGDGQPALTFHKTALGRVKLESTDEKNEAVTAEAATLEDFLKDHAALAQKFGVTESGIDYAGARVSFKGQAMPDFAFPRFPQPPRRVPPPPPAAEKAPADGAVLDEVDDSVRAQLDLPEGQGAVVARIVPGSVAERLGLRRSDIVLEIDGRRIASPESAKGLLTPESRVTLLRKGKRETLGGRKDF